MVACPRRLGFKVGTFLGIGPDDAAPTLDLDVVDVEDSLLAGKLLLHAVRNDRTISLDLEDRSRPNGVREGPVLRGGGVGTRPNTVPSVVGGAET